MEVRKFKIEYEPDYKANRYALYRSIGGTWFKVAWERMGSYETEAEAKKELDIMAMFPKVFKGDVTEGIYNR